MSSLAERLKRLLSYSEIRAIKAVINELGEETEKTVVNSKIADQIGITRSVIVTAFKMLEAAGVIETRSLGMKGTNIKVIDAESLKEILTF